MPTMLTPYFESIRPLDIKPQEWRDREVFVPCDLCGRETNIEEGTTIWEDGQDPQFVCDRDVCVESTLQELGV